MTPPSLVRMLPTLLLALTVVGATAKEKYLGPAPGTRQGYVKGDTIPVSCLNRTIDDGQHIQDSLGNLQYIPFPACNETGQPLAFTYATPARVNCTIEFVEDDLYHLLEYFVHSDVPVTCRVPTYPLPSSVSESDDTASDQNAFLSSLPWTPLTIALQGTLENSHIHIHTNINTLFHSMTDAASSLATGESPSSSSSPPSTAPQLIAAAAAYSVPETSTTALFTKAEGTKVVRTEPLTFTFNTGWIEGIVLPGMVTPSGAIQRSSLTSVKDHDLGFILLSLCALTASAGLGAIAMMILERKRSRGWLSGLGHGRLNLNGLGGGANGGPIYASSSAGVREMGLGLGSGSDAGTTMGGYGGYGRYASSGKRD